jgi:hypothetical protein
MGKLHQVAPELDHAVTECAPALTPYPVSEVILGAVRNWASIVTLWNLALNPAGGPVQPSNVGCRGCRGVVTVNDLTGSVTYSLAFYQLGQLSRFVQPGAWRISSEHFVSYGVTGPSPGLDDAAFLNPDGSRVLVAYNNGAARVRFAVAWAGRSFTYTLAPQATVTFVWNRPGAMSQPAVGMNPKTGQRYAFWQGGDGYIDEASYSAGRWQAPITMKSWGQTSSAPAVAVSNDSHQYVFWLRAGGDIEEAWYVGGRWNGPVDMTTRLRWGKAASPPAVAVNPTNDHQYVFWRDSTGKIHEAWYDGRWRGPLQKGWRSPAAPSVAVGNDEHQYVFWRGQQGDLWEAWHTATWHGPQDMTRSRRWSTSTSSPAVAVNPSTTQQYVFWRDTRGDIAQTFINRSGWHGPYDMTALHTWGQPLSGLGAAVANDYTQEVLWRGTNTNIWEANYSGRWGNAADMPWH